MAPLRMLTKQTMIPAPKIENRFGDPESVCWWFIRHLQSFEFSIQRESVGGAVTGGYFGSNTCLNLSDGVLTSYGGQNLEIRYSDSSGEDDNWGVLESDSGADVSYSYWFLLRDRVVRWFT